MEKPKRGSHCLLAPGQAAWGSFLWQAAVGRERVWGQRTGVAEGGIISVIPYPYHKPASYFLTESLQHRIIFRPSASPQILDIYFAIRYPRVASPYRVVLTSRGPCLAGWLGCTVCVRERGRGGGVVAYIPGCGRYINIVHHYAASTSGGQVCSGLSHNAECHKNTRYKMT